MAKKQTASLDKITRFAGPEESPGYLLWRVSSAWRSSIEATLKQFGLTQPQFVVLTSVGWLTKDGEQVSQAMIGKTSGFDPNTTSQILRSLETKKLIERSRSIDERSKSSQLSRLGQEIVSKALPAVEDADVHFFSILNAQEYKALLALFQKLKARDS